MTFVTRQSVRVLAAPMIPSLMARRIDLARALDFGPDCRRIAAPTLVMTGEERLDRVVPVAVTRAYASLIPGARYEMLRGTGHIGILTQPSRFAEVVSGFVHANHH
jgi:3-oxoadipate enol-lactonase